LACSTSGTEKPLKASVSANMAVSLLFGSSHG
jgi:hypothetical protein